MPDGKRQLFNQIYYYAKLNQNEFSYGNSLDISGIVLEHFKSFIQSGDVYWKQKVMLHLHGQNKAISLNFLGKEH